MPGVTRWYSEELKDLCGHPVAVVHQPEFLRAAKARGDAMHPRCIVIGQEGPPSSAQQLSERLLPVYQLAQLFLAGE